MRLLRPICILAVLAVCAAPAFGQSTGFTMNLTNNPSTTNLGQAVTLTVTGNSAVSGTVIFFDNPPGGPRTQIVSAAWVPSTQFNTATATQQVSSLAVGTHFINASYTPASGGSTFTSNTVTQTVNKGNTSLSLSSQPDPSTYGQAVNLSATVSPSGATGTVSFFDGTLQLGTANLINGTATTSSTIIPAGNRTLRATYSGDANYNSSSGTTSQTVNKANTTATLSSAPNPSLVGERVIITATISAAGAGAPPTGTVTFLDGQTSLGSAQASGTASISSTTLAEGAHILTAQYIGDNNYNASNAPAITQIVGRTPTQTSLGVTPNPANAGQTVTMTATVTPSGATGTVRFLDGANQIGTGTLLNGTATFQATSLTVGAHTVTANYLGDNTLAPSTSSPVNLTVNPGTSVSLSVSPNPATFGQTVTLTATVTPSSSTGNVTFFDGTNPIGNGSLSNGTASFATSSLSVGTHPLTAVFGQTTSNVVSEVINKANSSTTLTGNPTSITFGQTITFTATVNPSNATGTVTFLDGTNPIGAANLNNGTATFAISTLAVGGHSVTASYAGNATLNPSTSNGVGVSVAANTGVSLSVSPNPGTFGQPVTLTATVSQSTSTGTVNFFDGTNQIGTGSLSNGTASFATSSLSVGTHSLTAVFGQTTSNAVLEVINKANSTTTLTGSPTSVNAGQTVTFTATVSPSNATGTVTFLDGTNPIGTANLNNGTATFATSTLAVGSHSITASYAGNATLNPSTSNGVGVSVGSGITATTTSLSVSPNPANAGAPVTLNALVSPAGATGTVTFRDGTNPIGQATLSGGSATLVTTFQATGSHGITASYAGDTSFSASSSALVPLVINATLTATSTSLSVSPNPANIGAPVTLNAVVSPAGATGTVTFRDGTNPIGQATLSGGSATLATSFQVAGSHGITAAYAGDGSFSASSSALVALVISTPATATQTSISASPNPANVGAPVTLNATVLPTTATGTVTFRDGNAIIGTVTLNGGSATLITSSLTTGSHTLTAEYVGDANHSGSTSNQIVEVIGQSTAAVVLSGLPNPAAFGQPVVLTVTITPATATGSITIFDAFSTSFLVCLAGTDCTVKNGVATLTTSSLAVGTHSLQAFYSGDGNNPARESNIFIQTINPATTATTTTLTAPATAAAGQTVTMLAAVTGSGATGFVVFREGTTTLGTVALSNGAASLSTSTLAIGSHVVVASYSGDSKFAASTSAPVTITIGLQISTTALSVSPATSAPGQAVTLTAIVTPFSATGTVTFVDGSTTLGTATLSGGTATLTVSTLSAGTHSITASYGGDSSTGPSTSSAVTATVAQLTPTQTVLTASPNPAVAGQTVTLSATVTPAVATGTVAFRDGATTLGTATLNNGSATLTTTFTAGSHTLTASYSGDGTRAASTSGPVTETVNPGPSVLITTTALPSAFVNTSYSQTLTASGGTGTLTWTLASGAAPGLTLSAAGVLSGTPTTAGDFQLTVRVQDTVEQANAAVLRLTVNPAVPPVNITVTQPATITDQPAPQASLAGYPLALSATYRLTFTPNAAGLPTPFTNPAVQFVTGGTSATVTMPANSTAPVALPAVQLGNVAGTISVQLASLTIVGGPSSGQSVPLPSPVPSAPITVPRLAPVIMANSVRITGITATGFQVVLNAVSTPRDVSSASLTFTAASGAQLNGTSFPAVSLTAASAAWFVPANSSDGGAFSVTIPFTFSGDTSALNTVSVTLTNSVGTSAAVSGGR